MNTEMFTEGGLSQFTLVHLNWQLFVWTLLTATIRSAASGANIYELTPSR